MRLQNKVALITGASSGIGKGIAERFAAEGAHVAINYRDHGDNAAKVADILKRFKTDGLAVEGDVAKRVDMEKAVSQTVAKFGRLDIVVSNAGMEINQPFLDMTDDNWNQVISTNLYGAFIIAQAGARQMVKQGGGGKLVFISSVHEDIPFVNYTAYCASKGGLRMMMRNLAMELAPYKINCNNVAPGAIATPINQKVLDDPVAKKNAISEIPWGRFGEPDEVASVALFLASGDSDYVTGSTYYVDGGLTQQVTKY